MWSPGRSFSWQTEHVSSVYWVPLATVIKVTPLYERSAPAAKPLALDSVCVPGFLQDHTGIG
jgi:hypothetical protein